MSAPPAGGTPPPRQFPPLEYGIEPGCMYTIPSQVGGTVSGAQTWDVKDPQDVRTLVMDWEYVLGPGKAIASVAALAIAPAAGLSIGAYASQGSLVFVQVADGVMGANYSIGVSIIDTSGNEVRRSAILQVATR